MNDAQMPEQPKRPRGGQKGNQNARVHGRYSRLKPADRHAELRRVLLSYGFKQTPKDAHGTLERILDDPNTPPELVAAFLRLFAMYIDAVESLHRLGKRARSERHLELW